MQRKPNLYNTGIVEIRLYLQAHSFQVSSVLESPYIESSESSRNHVHTTLFRNAVRLRDSNNKCDLTGKDRSPKTKHLAVTRIFGVERSLAGERVDAEVANAYDTGN